MDTSTQIVLLHGKPNRAAVGKNSCQSRCQKQRWASNSAFFMFNATGWREIKGSTLKQKLFSTQKQEIMIVDDALETSWRTNARSEAATPQKLPTIRYSRKKIGKGVVKHTNSTVWMTADRNPKCTKVGYGRITVEQRRQSKIHEAPRLWFENSPRHGESKVWKEAGRKP